MNSFETESVALDAPRGAAAQRLGVYLLFAAALEMVCAVVNGWLGPRAGWVMHVPEGWRGHEERLILILEGISAAWLLLMGTQFARSKHPFKTYIFFAIALAAPTTYLGLLLARETCGHACRTSDIYRMLILVAIVDLVPIGLACRAMWEQRQRKASALSP